MEGAEWGVDIISSIAYHSASMSTSKAESAIRSSTLNCPIEPHILNAVGIIAKVRGKSIKDYIRTLIVSDIEKTDFRNLLVPVGGKVKKNARNHGNTG